MNYDRIIIELLDRVAKLEEKVSKLEKLALDNNFMCYNQVDEESVKTRDKTRYVFEGRLYLKNRLVYEIVKKYILDHPQINFNDLNNVFYDKLQGSFGVVKKKENIDPKKGMRYFFKNEDILYLSDGTAIVICNQWGKENIKPFLVLARSLGYEIIEA